MVDYPFLHWIGSKIWVNPIHNLIATIPAVDLCPRWIVFEDRQTGHLSACLSGVHRNVNPGINKP